MVEITSEISLDYELVVEMYTESTFKTFPLASFKAVNHYDALQIAEGIQFLDSDRNDWHTNPVLFDLALQGHILSVMLNMIVGEFDRVDDEDDGRQNIFRWEYKGMRYITEPKYLDCPDPFKYQMTETRNGNIECYIEDGSVAIAIEILTRHVPNITVDYLDSSEIKPRYQYLYLQLPTGISNPSWIVESISKYFNRRY